ncbi:MAG TPA: ChrR family anti-sigma-E factor [Rhizomicrobium sp.]|nr:ChrR family anti-sigma-E factor [Rhizomicrobium sp.]
MSIQHHPADELLLSYAAGATDEAMALVLATHLALCPQCRRTVARAEAAGGALLESGGSAPLASDALQAVLSRLDEPVRKATPVPRAPSKAPEPLRSYIGGDLDAVRWTKIAGGISFKPLFQRGSARAQLIRSRAGAGVGLHSHRGEEFTLCLTGGYTDETGRYARGDLQSTTPDILHRPIADEGEDCIVLAVSDAPLLFRNFGIALIAKWFGF